MATLKTLKNLVYPVTLLTVVSLLSIVLSIYAIYLGFTLESPAIIYPIIVVPISAFIIAMYVIDRRLIKHIAYYKLMLAELVLVLGGYLLYSYTTSTATIHMATDEDYILVLYDTNENSMGRFSKKGLFNKELLITDNIVHLNPSLISKYDIRIFPPDNWLRTGESSGNYFYKGDSIHYRYTIRTRKTNEVKRLQQTYIDSLIALEFK